MDITIHNITDEGYVELIRTLKKVTQQGRHSHVDLLVIEHHITALAQGADAWRPPATEDDIKQAAWDGLGVLLTDGASAAREAVRASFDSNGVSHANAHIITQVDGIDFNESRCSVTLNGFTSTFYGKEGR